MSLSKIDNCVKTLTERLGLDRELQMDVAKELRMHLEEAVEEYRASGMNEEESVEAALKHFGPSRELADQIWQANRGRMRVRALVKWFLRVTLVPAAVAFTVFYLYLPISSSLTLAGKRGLLPSARWMPRRQERLLTDEQRFILYGDESLSNNVDRQESIARKFPDNPVYYANYIIAYLAANKERIEDRTSPEFAEILAKLDEGERLEPDNAFYNYLKASILMKVSSTLEEDPDHTYEVIKRDGTRKQRSCYKVSISDRQMFERGIEEYLKGNDKPFYTSHTFDMLEERLGILPPPSTLVEQIQRISTAAGVLLPQLNLHRDMSRKVLGYAGLLADEGRREEVLPLLKTMREPARKIGSNSRTLIEILVVRACQSISLGHAQNIYGRIGMPEEAEAVRQEAEEENAFYNSLWSDRYQTYSREEIKKHAGMLTGMLAPALTGYELPLAPMRTVEQTSGEFAGLGTLLMTFSLILVVSGILTSWSLWSCRKRGDGPMLYFVGWRRLGKLLLISLMLPLGLYVLYTRFLPFGGRGYGIDYSRNRFFLELLLTVTAIFWLTLTTAYWAIRRRALEAGMQVPEGRYFQPGLAGKLVGLILLILLIMFFIGWEREAFRAGAFGLTTVSLIALTSLSYFLRQSWRLLKLRDGLLLFRRTFLRSLLSILAFSLLIVGIACRSSLRSVEKANIMAMTQPGTRLFLDELEYTAFKHYRDYLQEQREPDANN